MVFSRSNGAQFNDWLRDASIVSSFDKAGYLRHERQYLSSDLAVDMTGRWCLVTGANSGIGLATARALAQRGADVTLLCRSVERGTAAQRDIIASGATGEVALVVTDVSDFDAVRAAVSTLPDRHVDVLVHNAGVLPSQRAVTADGFETTLATHVLGPHLMNALLAASARLSAGCRIIWVTSGGMYPVRLTMRDVNWQRRRYDGVQAYAMTKRMQTVLARHWAERLARDGGRSVAMHPGWADTPAVRTSLPRFFEAMASRLRTPQQGADTVVWLAVAARDGDHAGGVWFDRRRRSEHLLPWTRVTKRQERAFEQWCDEQVAGML